MNVGIIGYGVVGKRRRKHIDKHPELNTICVSDINFDGEGEFGDGVLFFKDYKKIFQKKLDIIFISLPNYLAASTTILGLENNCHVFCEKPPSRTVEEMEEVVKCKKQHPNLKLKYGFNHRYHDSVIKARNFIDSGDLGDVVSFRGVYGKSNIIPFDSGWRAQKKYSGGGILLDQGIHMLDLIRYFSSDYDQIYSIISNSYWKHDVEDNAFILMKNKRNQVASLHSTATQWQHRFRLEIILQEGLLELSGILSGSKSYGSETLKIITKSNEINGSQKEKKYNFLQDNSWKDEIDEFVSCIKNNNKIKNGTPTDALNVMKMINKIYRSDKDWWSYTSKI